MDNIERVPFENFLSDYLDIDKKHLEACRYLDESGEFGYEGLDKWYTGNADSLASLSFIGWLKRGESIEEAMI